MSYRWDNPEYDATDAAHPAWWRGHDHTTQTFCQEVNRILDGKDDGRGVANQPWESTRRRLISLAAQDVEKVAERIAKTKDGVQVGIGVRVTCPKGHEHEYQPYDKLSGRIYCTAGECWSDGCQSDSGSGTHYDASECTSVSALRSEHDGGE